MLTLSQFPRRFQTPTGMEWCRVTNADGAALRIGRMKPHAAPVASIMIGPGLSEPGDKYFETGKILHRFGFDVGFMNWRNQGGSEPYITGDNTRRHSEGFEKDARDLVQATRHLFPSSSRIFYLGHSMGAMIGLLAALKKPSLFQAFAGSAPLLGFMDPIARGNEAIMAWVPLTKYMARHHIPRGGPWKRRTESEPLMQPEVFSSDPLRMHLHDAWLQANPDLRVGRPTLGFIREASRTIMTLRREARSIITPSLILTAGNDQIVDSKQAFNLVARMPNAKIHDFPDAQHEVLMERDSIRRPAIKRILDFYTSRLP